ncbi:PIN domain-containing protein [Roseateles chitosanitabidus]|jgi:predicted nucleic-acid-binding protein|uniref:PIN domain-containing protein n=1 Tax=Roseateles chitosanitabidus TaxID=65048 RepID=UPI000834AA40|nr:type II toxin-antitoxin system VapC family toxin [Roseateles chitosanitabidus]
MSAIDTNVLVRFIVQDDSNQAEAVERLRRRHAHHDVRLFVSTTVILELEWVLRACFKFDKSQVLGAFVRIIESSELLIENEEAIIHAVESYGESAADLADCIHAHVAAAAGRSPLHTFDVKASKLDGAELLR